MLHLSESTTNDDDKTEFTDALDDFTFFDASNSFDSDQSLPLSNSSSLHDLNHTTHHSIPIPHSPALRRRRFSSKQTSKSRSKNSSDRLLDSEIHGDDGLNVSQSKSYKLSSNLKEDYKVNEKLDVSRVQFGEKISSLSSSEIITLGDDGSVNDQSVVVDSSDNSLDSLDTDLNLVVALVRLILKVISFQANLFVKFVTFPIWLTHSSYVFVTDPFDAMRRGRRYVGRRILKVLDFGLGRVKCIVGKCIKRKRLICKFCMQMGWGLLWSGLVGFVLVGLLVFAFVIGGVMMRRVVERPVYRVEQLSFDYTRDNPMAFVPIMSCPETLCLECNGKIKFGGVAPLSGIPRDHKLQATVLLTLPESNYNRNLGNFQVCNKIASCSPLYSLCTVTI